MGQASIGQVSMGQGRAPSQTPPPWAVSRLMASARAGLPFDPDVWLLPRHSPPPAIGHPFPVKPPAASPRSSASSTPSATPAPPLAVSRLAVSRLATSPQPGVLVADPPPDLCPPWQRTHIEASPHAELVAHLPDAALAQQINQRIAAAAADPQFNPDHIQPVQVNGMPGGIVGRFILFTITPALAHGHNCNAEVLAIQWVNRLRIALGASPLDVASAQARLHNLEEGDERHRFKASWYGPYFHGRQTATGEIFDQNDFTAAHPSLPFDTFLKVTHSKTGRSIIVRVNDRGPYVGDRNLDLSRGAAQALGCEAAGVVHLDAIVMAPNTTLARL
jgi:hypothetical protein